MNRKLINLYLFISLIYSIPTLANAKEVNNSNMTNKMYQKNTKNLTKLQSYVTQEKGTEPPFRNEYWNNKEEGIYVDVASGEPLFSSKDKYDSGTGWPSFTRPIDQIHLIKKTDVSLGVKRVEVLSKNANSHLGHVFNDGPKEKGGMRYCINSAALRFISKNNLAREGYPQYLKLFESTKNSDPHYQKAILAGGCFWGVEELIRKVNGVVDVKVGYTGGLIPSPSYKIVSTGISGHAEAAEITFDATKISYEKLLKFFFQIHDPTTINRQENDVGTQYRSEIFYLNNEQKQVAEDVLRQAKIAKVFKNPIVTKITKAGEFYKAEDYHQDYLQKNPYGYTCHHIRKDWQF